MKRTILLTLLLACGTAQGSEWVSVNKTDDGKIEELVDVSSIRVAGEIRRAWVKLVYAPHTKRGSDDDANKWESESVSREAFNCGAETSRAEALTIYYDDGTLWAAPAEISPTSWGPVPPDTLKSVAMQFICVWKQK
jgi:hypothetical protein